MEIIHNIQNLKKWRQQIPSDSTIGFTPTMGCLHEGHLSLLQKSRDENSVSILSIFVNPTQFNDPNDYQNYPKTEQHDIQLAEDARVDAIFMPSTNELYPQYYNYKITTTDPLAQCMEGTYRPGHFDGVLTVVMKLLMLVKPHRAYFGEKDYQQLKLIQNLVRSFFIDTEIVPCQIVREPSGLACSSRNNRLNSENRKKAEKFAEILTTHTCIEQIKAALTTENIHIDYIEKQLGRIFSAIKIDDIRLIDNREFTE